MNPVMPGALMKFLTPGQLAICLVLFFLPWVEVQCPMPDTDNLRFKVDPPGNGGQSPAPIRAENLVYTPLMTQTGWQVATGKYTFSDPKMEKMMESSKNQSQATGDEAGGPKEPDIKSAPLLFLFPVAALAGVVVGLVLPGSGLKKGILIGCCALVLLTAGGQAALGFPIEKSIKESENKDKQQGPTSPPKAGPKTKADGSNDMPIKTVFKLPFYLVLIFAVGGIVTAALEPVVGAGQHQQKRRYRDDDGFEPNQPDESDPTDEEQDRRRR